MSSKICIGCNIEFIPKWSKAVYCSISCSKKGDRNPTWKGEAKIHICPSCKKEFLPKAYLLKFNNKKCLIK